MEQSVTERKDFLKGGKVRRTAGFFFAMSTIVLSLLSGFAWFTVADAVIWANGLMALSLLVAGIAKDVVAIVKGFIK